MIIATVEHYAYCGFIFNIVMLTDVRFDFVGRTEFVPLRDYLPTQNLEKTSATTCSEAHSPVSSVRDCRA